jgi:thiaminase (transcriptional activator TenA)
MLLSEELWHANRDLVHACCSSPFIQALTNETLPNEAFIHYLIQDAFLVEVLARAYSIAAAKAPDWHGFSQLQILIAQVIESRRSRHQDIRRWQADRTPEHHSVIPQTTTQRYTDFLITTAWNEEIGIILIAILPYLRLHLELALNSTQATRPSQIYSNWRNPYGSRGFQDIVSTVEALVDRYATQSEARYSTYRHSLLCLRNFFDGMASKSSTRISAETWTLIGDTSIYDS